MLKIGDKIYFYGNYDSLGEIQTTKITEEIVITVGEITRVKNGAVFFILEGEAGERKNSEEKLNIFRDYGTSVYGVFDKELTKGDALNGIIKTLEARILQTKDTINKLVQQFEGL
jgi:hypothetical protein